MSTTTINAPVSWGQTQSILGQSYIFAAERIRLAMMDEFDPRQLGVIRMVGDLAGSGSDVVRVTHVDDIGFAERMTALAAENSTVAPSAMGLGYTTVTIGGYGMRREETWKNQILSAPGRGVTLEELQSFVPGTYLSTLRYLVATAGAGISASLGTTGTDLDLDTYLSLVASFREQIGSQRYGRPVGWLDPHQISQIADSFRSEPAYASLAMDFKEIQALGPSQVLQNFAGLGIDLAYTNDIVQSGGAYQGFVITPGAVGMVRASTAAVTPSGPAMYIPEFGLILVKTGEDESRTAAWEATAYMGVALGDTSVFHQTRLISQV